MTTTTDPRTFFRGCYEHSEVMTELVDRCFDPESRLRLPAPSLSDVEGCPNVGMIGLRYANDSSRWAILVSEDEEYPDKLEVGVYTIDADDMLGDCVAHGVTDNVGHVADSLRSGLLAI